ncbi:hypothetical protein HYPBUDRAFT_152283 [Hyphopichia burtonii NRRL Y-1933]|uniref:Protein HRI1 n=1 Tax=Hyphopichia burtonii NRRL Y-1933 TaxID=984485 RepID=A0A1E4RPA8_9ASCO|nr:hypothetical protein HYPBUDRAFT_152283 [Hyphopichia burtonii NRRL Y-1933]ODV69099.1 hypothetical protein HYPBUDRAFT_152283 [Hyphopichia burtonii NRRL Y-1933]
MSFSRRVSLQWIPEQVDPEESTSTYVITSPNDEFVDIRIYSTKYPYTKEKQEAFDKVFQWGITGVEEPIEGTSRVNFKHEVSTTEVIESIRTGKLLEECRGEPDVGDFSNIEGSEDRRETGSMVNFETGRKTDYIEIWRSLDPINHTPHKEVREPKETTDIPKVLVMEVNQVGFQGKLVRLGNWVQALVLNRSTKEIHIIRYHFDTLLKNWDRLIQYAGIDFPTDFAGNVGESAMVSNINWICKEKV